eukprot:1452448-Rhodomonas_salina.2
MSVPDKACAPAYGHTGHSVASYRMLPAREGVQQVGEGGGSRERARGGGWCLCLTVTDRQRCNVNPLKSASHLSRSARKRVKAGLRASCEASRMSAAHLCWWSADVS